jgi:hypothetical protein
VGPNSRGGEVCTRPGTRCRSRGSAGGDTTAYFEHIAAGFDVGACYDRCECPHWGYVFKGKLRVTYDDPRGEVVEG